MSSSAFALEALSDAALSAATGQAGLTITTVLPAAGVTGIFDYTDTNGGTGGPAAFATSNPNGADVLASFKLTGKSTMTVDAGATGGGAANVLFDITTDTVTGLTASITSASACATSNDTKGVCSAGSSILSLPAAGVAITLKGLDLQVLLGASSAQHFITASLPATFNLTIGTGSATGSASQLSVLDPNNFTSAATSGGIGVGELLIDPTVASTTTIDACTTTATTTCTAALTGGLAGLLIQSNATVDVVAYNVTLGNVGTTSPTAAIGNIALYNLAMSGISVMVSGH
jgi:hypothetical protein